MRDFAFLSQVNQANPIASLKKADCLGWPKSGVAPAILLLCLICVTPPAWALRCGTRVISEGDTSLLLVQRCGEPEDIQRLEKKMFVDRYDSLNNRGYREYMTQPYEIWTYNFGPGRLIYRITIEEGIINSIETAGRGY